MIVLEGMDGTGKSTLARLLVDRLQDYELYESPGVPTSKQEVKARLDFEQGLARNGVRVILDRSSHISDHIYAPYNTGFKSPATEEALIDFVEKGAFFIFCLAAPHIQGYWAQHVQKDYENHGHNKRMHAAFHEIHRDYLNMQNNLLGMCNRVAFYQWDRPHITPEEQADILVVQYKALKKSGKASSPPTTDEDDKPDNYFYQ